MSPTNLANQQADSKLAPDHAKAKEFLRAVYGDKPMALVVGFKDGVLVPAGTTPVLAKLGTTELFFHVATLKPEWADPASHASAKVTTASKGSVDKNGKEWPSHVLECPYLWLDCDADKIFEGREPETLTPDEVREARHHYDDQGRTVSMKIDTKLNELGITPFAKWRSGAGWQCLIKLDAPITPAEAEELVGKLHNYVGFDAVVRNPNRILRVPGSINFKSGKDGRVPSPCGMLRLLPTAIARLEDVRAALAGVAGAAPKAAGNDNEELKVDWSKVNRADPWLKGADSLPADAHEKLKIIVGHMGPLSYNKGSTDEIMAESLKWKLIKANLVKGDYFYKGWSEVTLAVTAGLKLCKDWTPEWVAEALIAPLPCNQHINKFRGAARDRAVVNAINHSYESKQSVVARETGITWRDLKGKGEPAPTIRNTIRALENAGYTSRHDDFHDRTYVDCGDESAAISDGLLTDAVVTAISLRLDDRYKIDLGENNVLRAIKGTAIHFDPVLDMLADVQGAWDGVKRLDSFAVDYLQCDDTELNRAIGRLMLLAAVRRARRPGCKMDYIFTLLSEEGWNKSSFFAAMAGAENFSDQKIFGMDDKTAQEQLCGVWWHENAELQGVSKADVDSVTAFASRCEDRARPAYGRVMVRRPRRSIEVASTNSRNFLKKQTGNRRWLILEVLKRIDVAAVERDRLQLLGEAAALEAADPADSLVVLPQSLWGASAKVQESHRERHTWEVFLENLPDTYGGDGQEPPITLLHTGGDGKQRVKTADLLSWLRRHCGPLPGNAAGTLSEIMRRNGWDKQSNGQVRINGEQVSGYFRQVALPLGCV